MLLSLGWLRVSGMGLLVAFVPLMMISQSFGSSRRDFWRMFGWVALVLGLWTVVTVWWIWYAAAVGTIAATMISIFLFGGIFMLYHYVSKRAKPVLAYTILICGWIWAEHLYLNGEVSFPWLVLGNGFARDVWAVQWYELTGAFGGSLWVLLSNVLIFETIRRKSRSTAAWATGVVVVPIAASLIIYFSLSPDRGEPTTVTVVQPNFEPYTEKYTLPLDSQLEIMLSLAAEAPEAADFVVFPETVIGDVGDQIWENNIAGSYSFTRFEEFRKANYPESQFVVGAMTFRRYASPKDAPRTAVSRHGMMIDRYNSALAMNGTRVGISHKSRLVVGVEKMPYMNLLKPIMGLIQDLGGTTGELGTDLKRHTFTMQNSRHPYSVGSGAAICYESIYGQHFAEFVGNGAQLMFVITNDGWWHDTEGYRQHFSYSRLRAIETRRWISRAANTGISGFVSPRGNVTQTLGWDKRGTLTETVYARRDETFYVRYGDYIARIATYVLMLGLLYFLAYRIRRRDRLVD